MSDLKVFSKDHDRFKNNRAWVCFINSLSGYKSANLVGTKSKTGQENLSIVSSVVHLGANPPLMGFVVRPHSKDSPRHTFENLESTSFFTLNHVNDKIIKESHQTSARYPREVSEILL